jgi:para-aminobenzoate synthetase component 1
MRDETKKDFSFLHPSSLIPHPLVVAREIPFDAPDLLFALLGLEPERRVQILDSCGTRGGAADNVNDEARYLIAGFDPFETIEVRGRELRIERRDRKPFVETNDDALGLLDARLAEQRIPHSDTASLPANGACIATLSYDLFHHLERRLQRRDKPHRSNDEPDAVFSFYDSLIVHDYRRGQSTITTTRGSERLDQVGSIIEGAVALARVTQSPSGANYAYLYPPECASKHGATSNFTRDEYLAAVLRIKEHIAAGDIYQANLTQQMRVPLDESNRAEKVFLRLRRDHPASFAAFIRRREDTIVSASPERFLSVRMEGSERRIEAWPIKGTRARGISPEEDAQLREELYTSEKDRAENVMIVDLLRNDLGRVCRYGSVEVTELFTVQEHPTLFHLVSKVRGRLREGVSAGDIIRATFPCGSITGAPKIRAIEIIGEVETAPRGLSMGAIGYFSFAGAMDLNVAIRTITFKDNEARFNVGGGIVADSDPALEYEESLVKARALLRALCSKQ